MSSRLSTRRLASSRVLVVVSRAWISTSPRMPLSSMGGESGALVVMFSSAVDAEGDDVMSLDLLLAGWPPSPLPPQAARVRTVTSARWRVLKWGGHGMLLSREKRIRQEAAESALVAGVSPFAGYRVQQPVNRIDRGNPFPIIPAWRVWSMSLQGENPTILGGEFRNGTCRLFPGKGAGSCGRGSYGLLFQESHRVFRFYSVLRAFMASVMAHCSTLIARGAANGERAGRNEKRLVHFCTSPWGRHVPAGISH